MDEGGNSDQVNPAAGPISPVVAVRASSPLEWPLGLDSGAKRSELKLPSRPMRGFARYGSRAAGALEWGDFRFGLWSRRL